MVTKKADPGDDKENTDPPEKDTPNRSYSDVLPEDGALQVNLMSLEDMDPALAGTPADTLPIEPALLDDDRDDG